MIRLRMAGGLLTTEWVALRMDKRGNLHAVVERTQWKRPAVIDQDITVDIDLEEQQDGRLGDQGSIPPTGRPEAPGDAAG